MKTILAFVILLIGFTFAFAQNEQAPIQEKIFTYKDWTYKSINDGKEVNLREFTNNKKLVLVVYFAPWCHNWKHEAPFAQKLYEKYKANGLDVIGIGEYDTVAAMKTNINDFKITFPVVYESESQDARQKTLHYDYRKEAGDTRSWGSPWNIFIEPKNLKEKGDTLTKQGYVANGELIEIEAEKFVREKLGLLAEQAKVETTKKSIELCPEVKTADFQKP